MKHSKHFCIPVRMSNQQILRRLYHDIALPARVDAVSIPAEVIRGIIDCELLHREYLRIYHSYTVSVIICEVVMIIGVKGPLKKAS